MIFSSNFFPCIEYMRAALSQDTIFINTEEQYRKQTYSTRAYILGPHQIETLNVPVKKHRNNEQVKHIAIDYSENWNVKAWKAICNNYKNSPYFEYFEEYIKEVFTKKYDSLVDFNHDGLTICLKLLNVRRTICLQEFSYYDYKNQFVRFNAKNRLENELILPFVPYTQVFGSMFEPNLSVLDLLFSKGNRSLEILNLENQVERH